MFLLGLALRAGGDAVQDVDGWLEGMPPAQLGEWEAYFNLLAQDDDDEAALPFNVQSQDDIAKTMQGLSSWQ